MNKPSAVRVVKITDEEAASVGVSRETVDWGSKILPLLIAKGVPEEFLQVGDMRCVPVDRIDDPKHPENNGVIFAVAEH